MKRILCLAAVLLFVGCETVTQSRRVIPLRTVQPHPTEEWYIPPPEPVPTKTPTPYPPD
jgi:hypothetical protein